MDKVAFEKLIDSLKKFARPELFEDGTDILDELYTDLLSNDLILKKCLKERTTLLIGRKGTGKSTLFLKIENEIAKKADQISCFIDTKTIYEHVSNKPFSNENEIDDQILKEYMIKRSFVKYILGEVLDKIEYKIEQSPFERIIKLIGLSKKNDAISEIKKLRELIETNEHLTEIELPMLIKISKEQVSEKTKDSERGVGVKVGLNEQSFDLNSKRTNGEKQSYTDQFSRTLITVFDINGFIDKLKNIMLKIGIKKAFILLDDFSEINDPDITTFVDTVLMPLNNWSDQFFIFKIAAYPHRFYLGGIDQSKIDKVYLDFYNLHASKDIKAMENASIDFKLSLKSKHVFFSELV